MSALIDEALKILELYQVEGREHPKHVLNELIDRLKICVIRWPVFAQDVRCLTALCRGVSEIKKPAQSDMWVLMCALRSFREKMGRNSPMHQAIYALDSLFSNTDSPRYKQIDDLLCLLANELVWSGFSMVFIAGWFHSTPFRWSGLSGCLHHLNSFINENPVRTFTSYFRLHAPDEWAPQNLQAYGVEIHPYNPDQDKGIGLPSDGAWVANVKVECRDKFRAAYDGRLRVKEATGLFQIGSVSAEKTISPRACVIEGQRESTVDVAGYKPYLLDVRNLPRFLNAQKRAGASWSSATIIRDAAYWYHVSAEASTQHVRLISLWTVLELLIDVHGGSIAERVFRYVPPFLVLYYVPLLVDYLMSELAELAGGKDDQSIKQAAVTAAGYGGNAKAAFAKYIVDNVEDIELLLGNRDVPRRFLRLFVGLMNEKGQLTDHLEKYNHEVICDLRRSYRYRNWLVHRVVVTSHTLDRTVERLEFYVRTVINGILMGLTVSPSLDVQDVIISRSETCHHYLGLCNNHRPIDIIEDVVSPRFLYL